MKLPGLVFAVALLLAGAAGAGEREDKEAELKRIQARITELRQDLDTTRDRYTGQRRQLREVEEAIGGVKLRLRSLDERLEGQLLKLQELEAERTELNATVNTQRDRLAEQVRSAFTTGRQEYLKILLNQEDPAAIGRMLTYYDYLNRARSERIQALLTTLERLEAVRVEIADESRRLDRLRTQQQQQREQLEASRGERQTIIAALARDIRDKDERLEQMRADREELERLLRALAKALADIPPEAGDFQPFGKLRGQLKWPSEGRILAGFGSPRGQTGSRWQGVLIDGNEGQPVQSVARGRVAFAEWLRGYGLLVIVDHDDGYMTLYGHNESLYKEAGDWVEAGEIIAALGSTGGQERTALYFEIRHDGRPKDPVSWCGR
ncbi:murein hydrolase activator EnvC family protein [Thiohalomonas denitrificans]|uniref:Septal ring factor EnvC, activator of murein hydrolases AmiA and AmiB n=1 Tax=Thiohalomonas denitrificans TaxID=415747 RepID=A0A1G5QU30_9GAMM|nr:peptidoglycan DD-metalloendopeptidase family protein [Thiohalomonas denitrificans]SCZ65070.1 Septal ring factor EnvC, activator of murein hydrolases AmiA and AmiB [Thiohalomonas denitrificans]